MSSGGTVPPIQNIGFEGPRVGQAKADGQEVVRVIPNCLRGRSPENDIKPLRPLERNHGFTI